MKLFFEKKAIVAELIGTFGLVFFGGMAVMQADAGNLSLLGVAIAHFLILSIMMYFSHRYSGAHVNPAVTLSFLVTKKMSLEKAISYWLAQLGASILAGLSLLALPVNFKNQAVNSSGLGYPQLATSVSPWAGLLLETLFTFFLVFVFWAMIVDDKAPPQIFGLAIGGIVGAAVLAIGPLTGAALNPARVFGPSIVFGVMTNQWIYYLGPLIGGALAGITYEMVFLDGNPFAKGDGGDEKPKKASKKDEKKVEKKTTKKATKKTTKKTTKKATSKAKSSDE